MLYLNLISRDENTTLTKVSLRLIHAYYFEYRFFTETDYVFCRFMYIFMYIYIYVSCTSKYVISIVYCVGNLLHAVIRYWPGIDFGEYIHVMYNTVSRLGGVYCYPHMDALCVYRTRKRFA